MRTTIVLDDSLFKMVKDRSSARGVSSFINKCIRSYFDYIEKQKRLNQLESGYARAAQSKSSKNVPDPTEIEDWPEW